MAREQGQGSTDVSYRQCYTLWLCQSQWSQHQLGIKAKLHPFKLILFFAPYSLLLFFFLGSSKNAKWHV